MRSGSSFLWNLKMIAKWILLYKCRGFVSNKYLTHNYSKSKLFLETRRNSLLGVKLGATYFKSEFPSFISGKQYYYIFVHLDSFAWQNLVHSYCLTLWNCKNIFFTFKYWLTIWGLMYSGLRILSLLKNMFYMCRNPNFCH